MALKALKTPKTAEELIGGIDWKLLKEQKKTLLTVIDKLEKNGISSKANDLTGILNLVDSIQDYAVDVLKVDENLVFNITDEYR